MVAIVSGSGLGLYNSSLNLLGSGTGGQAGLGRLGERLYVNSSTGNLVIQQQDEYIPAQGLDLGVLRTYNSQGRLDDDNGDNWRLGVYRRLTNESGTRNSAGALITRVGEDGAETVFTCDSLGVYRSTDGDGAHDTLSFNTGTGQWTYTDGSNRDTETYNSVGQLVSVADRDGTVTTYTYSGSLITQISQTGSTGIVQTLYLDYNASNQLTQVRALNNGVTQTRVRYSYDTSNRLSQVSVDLSPTDNVTADGRVYTTTYTYDGSSTRIASITQGDGTRMSFTYVLVGSVYKVDSLTDGLNRTTRFSYVSATQTDVTDPLGLVTSYYNDASNRLAEIRGPAVNGVRPSTFYQYDADSNLTRVTDPQGNAVVYQYDTNGNATLVRDAAGNTITRTYSTTNQLLTESTYLTPDPDAAGPLPPSAPQTTRYAYDGEHHLRFVISAEGRVSEYQYNTPGKRTASIQYLAGIYSVSGLSPTTALSEAQLTSWVGLQDKAQTQRTNYSYEFHGLISSQTTFAKVDASGAGIADGSETRTSEWYQNNGDHWARIDANGAYTVETFDGLGRRIHVWQSGTNQTTQIAYDDANNRIITTQADGLVVTAVYNRAGELVSRLESQTPLWQQDFLTNSDGLGALPAGYMTLENGRLKVNTQTLAAGSPAAWPTVVGTRNHNFSDAVIFRSEVTTGATSAGRNLMIGADNAGSTAPATNTYRRYAAYFSGNQLYAYFYNPTLTPGWQSVALTTPANLVKDNTSYVVEVLTQSTGTTLYVYEQGKDRASGWTHSLSGASWHNDWGTARTFLQTYGSTSATPATVYVDNLSESKPPFSQTTYTYDANGRLRHSTDALGQRSYYLYDEAGRQILGIDATGALTEKVYNQNGQVAKTIAYATRLGSAQLATLINADGTPATLSTVAINALRTAADTVPAERRVTYRIYDAANRLAYQVDEGGYVTQTQYDGASRITAVIRYNTPVTTTGWPATPTLANIAVTQDADYDRHTRMFYDADGRLLGTLDAEGYLSENQYNAGAQLTATVRYARAAQVVGNAAATTTLRTTGSFTDLKQNITAAGANAADQTTRHFYNGKGQQIALLDAEGYLTEYSYDLSGNRTEAKRWANRANAYSAGSTIAALRPAASLPTDPAQDQVSRYSYDAANRLQSETDPAGTVTVYQYDQGDRVVKVTRGLEVVTDPAGITQTYMEGTQRVGVVANGQLTTYDYNASNQLVRERLHTSLAQAATWSQDFSANSNGLSSLTGPYFQRSGSRLSVTTQNVATTTDVSVTGTTSYALSQNLVFRAEVTTSASSTGRYLAVGAQGSTATRQLTALFDGDKLYAAYYDTSNVYRTFQLSTATNPLKNNTAYVVEVVTNASSVTLYVYERGKDASTGVSYSLANASSWGSAKFLLQTRGSAGRVVNTNYVDNLSAATVRGRLLPGGLIAPEGTVLTKTYVYAQDGYTILGRTLADSRVTSYRYDLQGRLTAELTGIGNAYLESYLAINSAPSQTQIDSNWTNYGVKHSYDAAGRRTSTTDQLGHTTYFYYDENSQLRYAVTPADNGADLVNQGEVAEVQYNAFGEARFTRRFSGRISTVGLSGGSINQDFMDRLGTIVNPSADATTTTNYTLRGAIKQILDAESKATTYSYNAFNERYSDTTTLDASKTLNTYYEYDRRGLLLYSTQTGWNQAPFSVQWRPGFSRQYDAFGRVTHEWDSRNNQRLFAYDRLGRTTTVTDPLNHSQTSTYDAFGRVLTQTDALNHTTRYEYNDAARTLKIITPEGVSTTTTRNRHGETVSVSDGRNNTATFVYSKNGKLTRHTNAAGEATVYLYDNADRMYVTWDASFRYTSYTFDAANRVLTRASGAYLALTTSYRYDALGRTVTVIDPNGVATKTAYDRKGQVTAVTVDPTSYLDAEGNTISNPSGLNLVTAYSYDDVGHTLSITEGSGTPEARTTEYQYDALGRRTRQIVDPGTGHLNLTTAYSYDQNDNVIARTEGLGTAEVRTTRYVYDANNRLTYQVDGALGVTKTDYDNEGRVLRTSAYANTLNTTAVLTAAGYTAASIAALTPDQLRTAINNNLTDSRIGAGLTASATTDRITWHAFDRDGREVYTLNALGVLSERQYDANGNVTQVTVFAEPLVAATIAALSVSLPDANKGLLEIHAAGRRTNADNRVSRTVYDTADRPVFQIDGLNYVTEARYDGSGNLIATTAYARAITLPASLTAATLRTAVDAIANTATDHTTRTVYDAANRARYTIDALGYVTETQYDNVGRIKQTTAHYTAVNNATLPAFLGETEISTALTARANPQTAKDQVTRYDYDKAGRLTIVTQAAATPDQYTESYAYDAVGQMLRHTNGRNHSEYFAYDTAGRVKRHIDYAGYAVDSSYDALGQRTAQTTSMNPVALPTTANDRYAYTASNPTPNTDPVSGDRTVSYTYDLAGRIRTQTAPSLNGQPGVVTRYLYNSFGNPTDTIEAEGLPEARTTHSVYNSLGQLTEQTTAYGAPEAATTRFSYDAFGNQKSYLDPRGVELAERDTDWAKAERLRLGYTVGSGTTLRAKLVSELTSNEQTALRTLYTTTQDFDRLNRKTAVTDALGNRTQTQYDAFGNIVKVTDPNLNVGYFYYDARNRVTFQVDPEGYATQTVYDATGNTTETVKYANKVQGSYNETSQIQIVASNPSSGPYLLIDATHDQHTRAEYDVLNRTSKITDAENHFETFQYDAQGNVKVHIDKNNSTFTYDYDAKGNKITEYLPATSDNGAGAQVPVINRYEYDAVGNQTRSIEAAGLSEERVTQYRYDKNNRLIGTVGPTVAVYNAVTHTTAPAAITTAKSYDARGNLVTDTDANGNVTYYYYDANDRRIATVNAERYLHTAQYNTAGNLIAERTYADRVPVGASLAALPNPTALVGMDPANYRETKYRYNANNLRVESATQEVLVYVSIFDTTNPRHDATAAGHLQSLAVTQTYDANGDVVKVTDANGNNTYSYYDKAGHKILTVDPLGYVTAWIYDGNGNVVLEARYATALQATTLAALTIATNPVALVAEVSGANNTDDRFTSYVYDRINRLTQEVIDNLNFFGIDVSGNLTSDTASVARRVEYDGMGNRTATINTDGGRTDYTYDGLNRLTRELGVAFDDFEGVSVRSSTTITYNGVGNVARSVVEGKTAAENHIQQFFYDAGGRRIREIDAENAVIVYDNDANGNVRIKHETRTDADGVAALISTEYRYDGLDRQTNTIDAAGVSHDVLYDAHGKIVKKGINGSYQEVFVYDKAGRLVQTNKDDGVYRAYLYDANGNETAKIQSAITDVDLNPFTVARTPYTLQEIAAMPSTDVQRTESVYDARNQLTATYQATIETANQNVSNEVNWVSLQRADGSFDPFRAGSVIPGGGETLTYTGIPGSFVRNGQACLYISLPAPIAGYPAGTYYYRYNDRQIFIETIYGDIEVVGALAVYSASTGNVIHTPGVLAISGQETDAVAVQLWLWRTGEQKPASPTILSQVKTVGGAIVPGYFMMVGVPSGNYQYEYKPVNDRGWELNYVRGDVVVNAGTGWQGAELTQLASSDSFAMDANGNEEHVWYENITGGGYRIVSRDRLASDWHLTDSVVLASGATGSVNSIDVKSGQNGNAVALWTVTNTGSPIPTIYASYRTQGGAWQAPVVITTTGNSQQFAMDAVGTAYIAWVEAGTVKVASMLSDGVLQPAVSVGSGGALKLVASGNGYAALLSTSTLVRHIPGGGWQPVEVGPPYAGQNGSTVFIWDDTATAVIDGNGNIWYAQTDAYTSVNSGRVQIGRYIPGSGWTGLATIGNHWIDPNGGANNGPGSGSLQLSVAPNGNLIAAWTRGGRNLSTYSGGNYFYSRQRVLANYYVAASGIWQGERMVDEHYSNSIPLTTNYVTNIYAAAQPRVAIDATGNAVVAWMASVDGWIINDSSVNTGRGVWSVWARRYNVSGGWENPPDWRTRLLLEKDGTLSAVGMSAGGVAVVRYNRTQSFQSTKTYVGTFSQRSVISNPFAPDALLSQWLQEIGVSVTDAAPVQYTIARHQAYNAFGEVTREIDGHGNATDLIYDKLGNLIEKRLPETNTTLANGLVVRQRPVTSYYYDIMGRSVGQRDANGNLVTQLFDSAGHLLADFHADGGVRRRGYDIFGNLRFIDNELLQRTRNTYDRKNRLTRVDRPTDGSFVGVAERFETYEYNEGDQRRSHTNAKGFRERTYYDAIGRVIRTINFFDPRGIELAEQDTDWAMAERLRLGYSTIDEATQALRAKLASELSVTEQNQLKALYPTTNSHYDYLTAADGSVTFTTTDGEGRTMIDARDYFGRIAFHKDYGNRTFRYFYNKAGWLTNQIGNTDPTASSLASPVDIQGNGFDPRNYVGFAAYKQANPGIEQYITFGYFRNGYLREVKDDGINTLSRYEYDDLGNRIFEGYAYVDPISTNVLYYQWSHASYDELNRITEITDAKYDVQYEYDLVGNRRRVFAHYHDGVNNNIQEQDYWYAYDNMNRFVVTKGALQGARGGGTIVAGTTGVALTYDTASNRRSANNESYEYNVDGLLTVTKIDNVRRSERTYDAAGNVVDYVEFGTDGVTSTWNNHYTYTYDNNVKTERPRGQNNDTIYKYDASGIRLNSTFLDNGGTTLTTTYSYSYWDDAKQAQIMIQASNAGAPGWKPGFSNFVYDTNGHLTQLIDVVANRRLNYRLESHGLIMERNEFKTQYSRTRTQWYHYFNGIGIGDAGMAGTSRTDYATLLATRGDKPSYSGAVISSADFDYNYQPINDQYPATTPGSYTVRAGDTFQSVALAVWGDSSLWYLIADANALTDNAELTAGQSLVIPNVVANIHNNASTFKVYNPGELIGDATPTLPDPPPPPISDNFNCGMVVIIIVAVVITILLDGATAPYLESLFVGLGASAEVAGVVAVAADAAIAAAAGSAGSQLVAMGLGLQDEFDWGAVGVAALTAGITRGIGSTGSVIGDAVVRNVVGQGVNIIAGRQEHFSWSSLAVAAISAPINSEIDQSAAGVTNSTSTLGATWDGFGADLANGLAKGMVTQGVSLLVNRGGTIQWANVAGEALGGALGNALGAEAFQSSRVAKLDAQIAEFGRRGYGYDINPNGSVARNYNDYTPMAYVNTGNNGGGGLVGSDSADSTSNVPAKRTLGEHGNSLYAIARNELGAGASEADVVNYTKQLMAANPNLGDPRTLQAGTSVNLPDANTNVSPAAEAAYNKSDAEYQTYRAEQAAAQMAAEAQSSSLGMMARQQPGFGLGLYGVAPGDDYFGFGRAAPNFSDSVNNASLPTDVLKATGKELVQTGLEKSVNGMVNAGRALLSDINSDVAPPSPAVITTVKSALKTAIPGVSTMFGVTLGVGFEKIEQGAEFNEKTEIATQTTTSIGSSAIGAGAGALYLALASNPVGWVAAAVVGVVGFSTGVALDVKWNGTSSAEDSIRNYWREVGVR